MDHDPAAAAVPVAAGCCRPCCCLPTALHMPILRRGAASGEGLGNAFLSHITAVDGIFHVCRGFEVRGGAVLRRLPPAASSLPIDQIGACHAMKRHLVIATTRNQGHPKTRSFVHCANLKGWRTPGWAPHL